MREQIREEHMDSAVDRVLALWKQELTQTDIIPANGLMVSAREISGSIHQCEQEVQAALRVGDKDRLSESLLNIAIATLHAYVSIEAKESLDF